LQRAHLAAVRAAGGVALLVDDLAVLIRAFAALEADPLAELELDGRPADDGG
jgi:hypothetical protein